MKTTKLIVIFASMLLLALMFSAPVNAVDPIVVNDVWFVAVATQPLSGANVSWTDNGAVFHKVGGRANFTLSRSPPGSPGSVNIGNLSIELVNLEFNNVTKYGKSVYKINLNLNQTNSTLNPYGVGTLQGVAMGTILTMHPVDTLGEGNGTGVFVATQGTGAFANAMLTIDVITAPFPSITAGPTIAIFFGTHSRVNGRGILTMNSLQGTYRDWKVMLHDGRLYAVPPATMTGLPLVQSIGAWDSEYYTRIGKTAVDAAKPYIDSVG